MTRSSTFHTLARSLGISPDGKGPGMTHFEQVGRVVPDARRCVQCGICSYNCPIGIPVRDYARQGLPVEHSDCITCGQCIQVCPRGTLSWQLMAVEGI